MLLMNDDYMNVQVSQATHVFIQTRLKWHSCDDETYEDCADEEGSFKTMMKLQYCACIHFVDSE